MAGAAGTRLGHRRRQRRPTGRMRDPACRNNRGLDSPGSLCYYPAGKKNVLPAYVIAFCSLDGPTSSGEINATEAFSRNEFFLATIMLEHVALQ